MRWDFSVVWTYREAFFRALVVTVAISAGVIAFGSAVGIILAWLSLVRSTAIRFLARVLVEALLALPALVLIIWIYFSLPLLLPGFVLSGTTAAILGLGLSLAAFVAEVVRAGIGSVEVGQLEAAYTTGLSRYQAFRHILLPQALGRVWPPLAGQYITAYKMSTLASIVAVPELLHTGGDVIARTYRSLEVYTAIALLFLVTVWPLNVAARRLESARRLGGTTSL